MRISDSQFIENTRGGGVSAPFGPLYVENCLFLRNTKDWGGGAIDIDGDIGIIRDSIFMGNRAVGAGAVASTTPVYISNCLFSGNSGRDHGAFSALFSASVTNSTIVSNTSDRHGGVSVGAFGGAGYFRNCNFYGNYDDNYGYDEQAQLFSSYPEAINVGFSMVLGWTGMYGGDGNMSIYPKFIDPLGPDGVAGTEDDDLRLRRNSQAINAGDPDFVPAAGATDLDGHARVLCGRVDIGAYEFGLGDVNCDLTIELADAAFWDECLTGPIDGEIPDPPYPNGCEALDADFDLDVDLRDMQSLQRLIARKTP